MTSTGAVRVTIPAWTPYQAGVQFARSRMTWINSHRQPSGLLQPGQAIGKAHHLRFAPQTTSQRISSRVLAGQIVVGYPSSLDAGDSRVQNAARAASVRALRRQAEQLLPQRLADLATRHGFSYTSVSIKQLKSRWGSCDKSKHIVLNLYLMQLPWQCIDYVLIHELIHTRVLHHGPDFWQQFTLVLPTAKQIRRQMADYQPVLFVPEQALEK
ncbi:MAG: SprT family zinc-dependent metalloprotease [Candidatus Saccharimonadales bacterium]